jgi:hypothetical protein
MNSMIDSQKLLRSNSSLKWLKKLKKLTGSRDRLLSFFILKGQAVLTQNLRGKA